MPTLYERYITGDTSSRPIWTPDIQLAQTFTVGNTGANDDHNITSVNLLIYNYVGHSPGTVYVGIRNVDGADKPTGSDLSIGSTNGNTLDPSHILWREINLSPHLKLLANTKYAIVVRCPTADSSNRVTWRSDHRSSLYTGGDILVSNDAGSSWSIQSGEDFMFEEYGESLIGAFMVMRKHW